MFHNPLDIGSAGQKVGVLLRGIKHDQVRRGWVVMVPQAIEPQAEFDCEVYLLSKEDVGRRTAIVSGYRPQFLFRTSDVTVASLLVNAKMALPSDNVQMRVSLDKPIAVRCGDRFAIREGSRTIGCGVVTGVQ